MTLRPTEQWAREWKLPGIGVMVEAVRAEMREHARQEFAQEAAVKLREHSRNNKFASHTPRMAMQEAADIVEALARPNCSESPNSSAAACEHDMQRNGGGFQCRHCGAWL